MRAATSLPRGCAIGCRVTPWSVNDGGVVGAAAGAAGLGSQGWPG